MPTGVFAATDDFAGTDLDARITRASKELAVQMGNLPDMDITTRRRSIEDEFADPTPFEDLLRQVNVA